MKQSANIMARFSITAIIVGTLVGLHPGLAVAAPAQRETVTVAASGKVEIEPDIARVSLGVRGAGPTASEAKDEAAADTRRVINALRDAGFTRDEVTVAGVHLSRREDRKGNFIGYVASVGIRVEIDELDRVGEVIDVGVEAGADSIKGVSFDVKDKREAVKQALREAMQFARVKAQVLAEAAGRERGRALVINEGGTEEPRAVSLDQAAVGRPGKGGRPDPFPIVPPTLTARATIRVVFELI